MTLVQDTSNSAKSLAQQIAKQMAREPLEILKDVREQATGEELSGIQSSEKPQQNSDDQKKLIENQNKLQDNMKSSRRMEALQREVEDIRKQEMFKDLQRRISEGEDVALEEYSELSMEQRQVLMAQKEAVKQQMLNAKYANDKSYAVPSISSKPSRRFGAGQKSQAQKEQTRVEKPVPPSG